MSSETTSRSEHRPTAEPWLVVACSAIVPVIALPFVPEAYHVVPFVAIALLLVASVAMLWAQTRRRPPSPSEGA